MEETAPVKKFSRASVTSTEIRCRECHHEWDKVFTNLDKADGKTDGKIDRKALVKWVSALDLNSTIEFERNLKIDRYQLERLVSKADDDNDGFVDKEEFYTLIDDHNKRLDKTQQSLLRQYLQIAAYADTYKCWPPPFFILLITFAQVCIYIYHVIHFLTHSDHLAENVRITWSGPEPLCSVFIYDPNKRHEFWRFASYSLVHSGVQHIVFNMVMQLCVGLPLEMSHGTLRVAAVYIAGVLAGSLGTSAVDPHVYLAGASGGVYALIAAHLATLALNWKEDMYIIQGRFRSGKATKAKHGVIVRTVRLLAVLSYAIVDTGLAVYHRHFATGEQKTGYTAHLCGAIVGLLIGVIVLKNRRVEHWETKLKVVCVVIFLTLFALCLIWNTCGDSIYQLIRHTNNTYFQSFELQEAFYNRCYHHQGLI